jgi:hypothetical protein
MIVFAGDSWALRGFTEENYTYRIPIEGDIRLVDHWKIPYVHCLTPGQGNLSVLDCFLTMKIDPGIPIIWIYTEPGRDYNRITGKEEFDWIKSEDIFNIRAELDAIILKTVRDRIKNPIGLIGGLSDINVDLAESLGLDVLHSSWQSWIAKTLNSQWFKQGWGASDVGWRVHSNNVVPSKAATFAWDEQIKEWCWWEENGYFCHEHPTPRANKEFAEYLQPTVEKWVNEQRRITVK